MNIIERWKKRRAAHEQNSATGYWQRIESLAIGELSEKAEETALEAVERLLPELGKTPDDVGMDIALVREFEAAKVANDEAGDGRAKAADLRSDAARQEERARQLDLEAEQLRLKAQEAHNQANSLTMAAAAAAQELARCKGRLVTAGHTELSARAADDSKTREVESLLGELTTLELGTAFGQHPGGPDARRADIVSKLRRLGHVVPKERLQKQLPGGRKSEVQELLDELSNLERGIYGVDHGSNVRRDPDARRAAIASRLRELGREVDAERLSRPLPNSRRSPAAEPPR